MSMQILKRLAAMAAVVAALSAPVAAQETYDTSRIVSLGGSVTEIIHALGEQDRLVARDSTSIHPAEARELDDVGYVRALSPEGVLSVDPTLIIAIEGAGPPDAVEVLKRASVGMVQVPESYDREGILEKIRIIGEVLGVEDKAQALIDDTDARIRAVETATAGIEPRAKVLFILSMQGGRIMASGTGTAADGIIAMAGGVNAITDFQGYKQLSDEAVIEAAPDFILSMEREGFETGVEEMLAYPVIASTPAAREGRILQMDGSFLLGFGPRSAAAARELAGRLYGDRLDVN